MPDREGSAKIKLPRILGETTFFVALERSWEALGALGAPKKAKIETPRAKLSPSWTQEASKRLQVEAKRRPRGSKLTPRGAWEGQDGPQESPSEGQECPRRGQVEPKRDQNEVKEPSKSSPRAFGE